VNRFVFYAFKFLSALLQLYAWQFLARSLASASLDVITDYNIVPRSASRDIVTDYNIVPASFDLVDIGVLNLDAPAPTRRHTGRGNAGLGAEG
jgi:hypothetical protein